MNFFIRCVLLLLFSSCLYAAEIYVHYDTGLGKRITIRGSNSSLNWQKGKDAQWTPGNIWVFTTSPKEGGFEFKPLINDKNWSIGANYKVENGNSIVHIYPSFGPTKGEIVVIDKFYSSSLDNYRAVRLYLPPSYNENQAKHYPVLYMHDGQNLFDPSTAFGGVEWQVDENLDKLIAQGKIREVIVVGMDNTMHRMAEYTPTADPKYKGGNGEKYLDFIEREMIPYINSNYRTLKGKENTYMMGSSLGGLISFYGGWTRNDVFGKVGCVSSSFWWNKENLVKKVGNYQGPLIPTHFYLDIGDQEGSVEATEKMNKALLKLGYKEKNLRYHLAIDGKHNEASWAKRVYIPLVFMLAK